MYKTVKNNLFQYRVLRDCIRIRGLHLVSALENSGALRMWRFCRNCGQRGRQVTPRSALSESAGWHSMAKFLEILLYLGWIRHSGSHSCSFKMDPTQGSEWGNLFASDPNPYMTNSCGSFGTSPPEFEPTTSIWFVFSYPIAGPYPWALDKIMSEDVEFGRWWCLCIPSFMPKKGRWSQLTSVFWMDWTTNQTCNTHWSCKHPFAAGVPWWPIHCQFYLEVGWKPSWRTS